MVVLYTALTTVNDNMECGGVAQLGERLNGIQEVKSSILSVSTMYDDLFF